MPIAISRITYLLDLGLEKLLQKLLQSRSVKTVESGRSGADPLYIRSLKARLGMPNFNDGLGT